MKMKDGIYSQTSMAPTGWGHRDELDPSMDEFACYQDRQLISKLVHVSLMSTQSVSHAVNVFIDLSWCICHSCQGNSLHTRMNIK